MRLVVALSVAALLSIFLLYTSLAGGATPSLQPSELEGRAGRVALAGKVVGPVRGDAGASELRFRLRDVDGKAAVPVVYTGTVPDLFRVGRHVFVQGELRNGTFVAVRDSMVTKCPSKYVDGKQS